MLLAAVNDADHELEPSGTETSNSDVPRTTWMASDAGHPSVPAGCLAGSRSGVICYWAWR